MSDRVGRIRHDYRASRSSGTRPSSFISYFVVHDMEAANPHTAAEGTGAWFASHAAQGSSHYGVDNDSTQQYLPDTAIPWGAPPLNMSGLHVECAGLASLSREQWLHSYGPMLQRLGWLMGKRCRAYRIPLRVLNVEQLRSCGTDPKRSCGGVVTNHTITDAFHKSTHTDPGPGFPMDVALKWAHHYQTRGAWHRFSRKAKP